MKLLRLNQLTNNYITKAEKSAKDLHFQVLNSGNNPMRNSVSLIQMSMTRLRAVLPITTKKNKCRHEKEKGRAMLWSQNIQIRQLEAQWRVLNPSVFRLCLDCKSWVQEQNPQICCKALWGPPHRLEAVQLSLPSLSGRLISPAPHSRGNAHQVSWYVWSLDMAYHN